MVRALVFVFLIHLALLIAAVADCLGGERSPRRLSRGVWVLIIVFLPIAGALLWFWLGRSRPEGPTGPGKPGGGGGVGGGPRRPKGPTAPDDDPDFLRDLDRQLRDDERKED